MKKGWETKSLGDVCTFRPPKSEARDRLNAKDTVSFVPMSDLGIEQKYLAPKETAPLSKVGSSYTYFADGDVLLAKITPCFENGKLGIAVGLENRVGFGSSEFFVLRPTPALDREFLYYFLSQPKVREDGQRQMGGAVGQQRVPKEYVEGLRIPLPPIPDQRRIVAILDEAFDGIATAKANAEKNLRNAREACDAVAASRLESTTADQPIATVADLALPQKGSIRTGPFGSQLLHSEFVNDGVAVLGIDNAVANEFQWGKRRFITHDKYRSLERYKVHPGDVIITIMGTCGRCAVIPDDIPLSINSKHLCCISLDQRKCLPAFLHAYFLMHPKARQYLAEQASGSIMDGLNMGIIKEMPVQLPPASTQADVVLTLNALKEAAAAANQCFQAKIDSLASLKASLLHQAFTGQL